MPTAIVGNDVLIVPGTGHVTRHLDVTTIALMLDGLTTIHVMQHRDVLVGHALYTSQLASLRYVRQLLSSMRPHSISPIQRLVREPASQFMVTSWKVAVCGQKPSELQNLPSDKTTAKSV